MTHSKGDAHLFEKVSVPFFDLERIRADFPILAREIDGRPLAYLDSANSAQKPRQMIDAMSHFYATSYANVHRAVYGSAWRRRRRSRAPDRRCARC